MTQYLMGLFVLGLCCAAVELLAPAGEGGTIGRHIKLMSALCLLCTLIAPVTTLLRDSAGIQDQLQDWVSQWADEQQTTQDFENRWQTESEQLDVAYAEQLIAEMLRDNFAIAASDLGVEIILTPSRDAIDELRVALTGRAIWIDTHKMEAYIHDTFGCDATIYIE